MTNPLLEWWQGLTAQWLTQDPVAVLRQFVALCLALALALLVDRLLERYRARWLGGSPEVPRLRAILWAVKFPALALLFGYLALALFAAAGWPADVLRRLVTLFWFFAAYALAAKAAMILLSPDYARRIKRRVLVPLLVVLCLLHLTGLLARFWAWASEPIITFASGSISVASIASALAIAAAFWVAARVGKALFLRRILPRTRTDPKLAYSVATFIQFAIIIVGLWIALISIGLELSNLALLITALTVGIGFGLQDVIKNIMGGMILLGEGHVRPDEVFQIGDDSGRVEQIGLRSTIMRGWDGSLIIIPNADLIADKVTELTDARRVEINVGVSCDADPRLAERLLLEVARAHPDVVDEPPPSVLFTNLGESTFDFTLYCYVERRAKVGPTQSDLHFAVVETFRRHNLEMPYRQLDVHLRSETTGP